MLLAYDMSFLICTPCKAGCMSLEATLRDRAKLAYQIGGRHGYRCSIATKRLMIIREPIARWVSMYWFIRKHIGKSCYMQQYATSMAEFAAEWDKRCVAGEDHWWFNSQTYIASVFKPDKIFKLEEDGIAKICEEVGCTIKPSHTNRNRHKGEDTVPVDIILKHWGVDQGYYL